MNLKPMERELAMLRYIDALERGDLDGIAAFLQLAEQDKELENMMLQFHTDPAVAPTLLPDAEIHGTNHHARRKIIPMPQRVSHLTFAMTVAATVLLIAAIIVIGTQPSDETSLSVQPIPAQQEPAEVDCLADRAYRVVYAEELPGLTTQDLKCAFIVGDMRGLDISHLDFSDTVMRDVNMSGGEWGRIIFRDAVIIDADLSEANLGRTNFSNASLVNADLTLSNLSRASFINANVRGAKLQGANMNDINATEAVFRDSDFSCADDLVSVEETPEATNSADENVGCENPTNLSSANLTAADLLRANLEYANLNRTNLFHAGLDLVNLENADLTQAIVAATSLEIVKLSGADFSNATLEITHIVGSQPVQQMDNVSFQQSDLHHSRIWYLDIPEANLEGVNLVGSQFLVSILTDANLSGADMSLAELDGLKLNNADFTNANMYRADLIDSDLTGSDLTGVDLTGAAFTDVIWTDVTLPDGTLWTEETDLTRFTDADHADYWRSDDPDSPAYEGE